MSAHVLLILLNELGKRDKTRGLPSILSLFRNEFNNSIIREKQTTFVVIGALRVKITSKSYFWCKTL